MLQKTQLDSEETVMKKMCNLVLTATVMAAATFGSGALFAQENAQNEEGQQNGMHGKMMQDGGMHGNMMGMMGEMNSMMEKCNAMMDNMMEKQTSDTNA